MRPARKREGHRFESGILHSFKKVRSNAGLFRCVTLATSNMVFYLYIIYSPSLDQYYVGHTEDLDNRLFRHNNSGSKSTKKANDWQLKYKETYDSRSTAIVRELEIKKKKSRKFLEALIQR